MRKCMILLLCRDITDAKVLQRTIHLCPDTDSRNGHGEWDELVDLSKSLCSIRVVVIFEIHLFPLGIRLPAIV
jgi:hypothetical protein